MKVICAVSGKGGVGKTTLASALAVRAARDGKRVAIVDLDPQESVAAWFGLRKEKQNLSLFHGADTAGDAIEALRLNEAPDYVFLDTPPAFVPTIDDAIGNSDLALIPLRPGALDLIGSEDAVQTAKDRGTPYMIVLNDVDTRWGGIASAREYLESAGVTVAKTVVAHRAAFLQAMETGRTGPEVGKDGKAAAEIDRLWLEVKALLKKGRRT